MKDLREQIIIAIANGVATKNGADQSKIFVQEASKAIVGLADAIIEEMNKDEE